MNRLLLISPLVIGLHFIILTIPMFPQKIIKPALAPIKRIAVSFISKPTIQKEIKKETLEYLPEQQPKKKINKPKSQPEKIIPLIKPTIKQGKKSKQPVKLSRNELPLDSTPEKIEQSVVQKIEKLKAEETSFSQNEEKQQTKPIANVIQEATPLYKVNPPPAYPRLARRRGLEGVVFIKVFISVSGKVTELKLSKSSGHKTLDKAAMKSVRKWQFIPGNQAGKPVEMWVTVPVHFKLMNN